MQIPIVSHRGIIKPWNSIPRIDWRRPLTDGLLLYHYDTGAGGSDLARSRRWSLRTANQLSRKPSQWGTGYVYTASVGDGIQYKSEPSLQILPPYSWACGFMRTVVATENGAGFYGRAANDMAVAPFFNWAVADTSSGAASRVAVSINNGGILSLTASVASSLNAYHTILASCPNTTNLNWWLDGNPQTGLTGLNIQNITTNDNIVIGTDNGGPNGFQGQVYWAAFWNRVLTQREATQLFINPYQFLIYPEDEMFATLVGSSVTPPGPGPNFLTSLLPMMGVG